MKKDSPISVDSVRRDAGNWYPNPVLIRLIGGTSSCEAK
jgi:hypothetical protein